MSENNDDHAIMDLLDFQRYQLAFTKHLRQPKSAPKPAKASAKGMAIYTEIVFNNIVSSVSACFPVAQLVMGKRAWTTLIRDFFINYQSQTPIYKEVPQEFLKFLESQHKHTSLLTNKNLPPFLSQLAHYEWIELALSTSIIKEIETISINLKDDLLTKKPVLVEVSALLKYDYPVHKISKKFKPTQPEATFLLVFRDITNRVQFIELNAVTFRLLQLLGPNKLTGKQALTQLTNEIKHPDLDAVIEFGTDILLGLKEQGAIVGVLNS